MNLSWSWEPAAVRGEPAPDGLSLIDKLSYLSIRGVYAQYRTGQITREEAQREKAEIRKLCEESTEAIERQQTILRVVRAVLDDTADLRRKIRKVKTAEEVALLGLDICAVLEGRLTITGYESFSKAFKFFGMEDPMPVQRAAV